MKHGDKKGKSVKAATQASAKEKRRENGGKKAVAAGKAHGEAKASKGSAQKSATKEAAAGQSRKAAKRPAEDVTFTNPSVAAAFKRSLKKYDTAYRRLTD